MRTSALTAGWYPNPDGAPGQRYWDGAEWIIIEIATTSVDPTASRVSVDERALRRTNWLAMVVTILIAAWAFAFFAVGGSAGERHPVDTAPGTAADAAPAAEGAAWTLPERCGIATDQAIQNRTGPAGLPGECVAAFLARADADGLSTHGGHAQLMIDAYVACSAYRANGTLKQISAAVRKIDPHLTGGYPVLSNDADIPAASLAWTSNATLCP